ncbi:MAG: efflux RND transporter periplasmic adaptor subunit [Planctomycetaceae bacterium]|nr:efflux RND transporter periplasmic adaptor subunit [Planctomycetaceae bacterium]
MNRLKMTGGLICMLMGGAIAGCDKPDAGHQSAESGGQSPVRVTTIQPQRKPLIRTVELPGRVEAYEVAPLHAKATGYVIKVPVDIGDKIQGPHDDQPGTLLCELQVPELKEELAQKAATVAQTKAEVLQTAASVKVADAAVRSANAKVLESQAAIAREESQYGRWQSEFRRVAQLAETGAVTQKVADETRAQLDAADAGRKEVAARIVSVEAQQQEALAALEKAKADAVAMRSRLAVAEADERRVAAMIEYTFIRAPFDGVVVERNIHTGHLVQAGASNLKPLLTVVRMDPVRVIIDIPEIDAVRVSEKTKVEIKMPSLPGAPYVGTVTRSSWSFNTTSRTLTAEIHVPNADGLWRPGQYVQVKLTVAELENGLSLPKSAIVTQDKQTYCFSVGADGKVVRLPIALGLQAGGDFEIREGLTGQEQIISANANAFREGQVVEIVPPPQ